MGGDARSASPTWKRRIRSGSEGGREGGDDGVVEGKTSGGAGG